MLPVTYETVLSLVLCRNNAHNLHRISMCVL